MDWRVLKFRPDPAACPARGRTDPRQHPRCLSCGRRTRRTRSSSGRALPIGELRIQRCGACGALRHPPGPACLACGATEKQEYQVAAGTGTVYSYVVHRHPPVPGKQLPIVIALVELTEGVRMLGELHGVSPEQVRIGMPVRIAFSRVDDELVLPVWREDTRGRPGALPELTLDVTPTRIVSTAIATRDFYPRPPRPRLRRPRRQQGHLPQHPDHDWPGAAVRHRLGRPGGARAVRFHSARRTVLRRRHADVLGPGHRHRR